MVKKELVVGGNEKATQLISIIRDHLHDLKFKEESKLTVTKKLDKVIHYYTICLTNFHDLKIKLNSPII